MRHLLLYLYKLMLRLYPGRFYTAFGPEMVEVFAQRLQHAMGNRALLTAFGRELRHWPGSCLREHWDAQQAAFNFPSYEKLSRRGTAVAALPYLLMALLFGAVYLVAELIFGSSPSSMLYNSATAVVIGILGVALAVAWWWHWPGWSVSWLGFLAFLVFYVVLPQLLLSVQLTWNTPIYLMQMFASELLLPFLLFGVFYWLVGRWPSVGAVVLLPPIGFSWLLHLGAVPQPVTSLIFMLTWGWLAAMVVLMVQPGNGRWQGWLLGLAASVIGLASSLAGQFWRELPLIEINNFQIGQSTASGTGKIAMSNAISMPQLMESFLSGFVPALLPLVAILLLHTLRRRLVKGNGRSALRPYRFLLWSIMGIIGASQITQWFILLDDLAGLQRGISVGVTAVFLLSLLGISLSVWQLRRHQSSWLLLLLVVFFPFLSQMETISILLIESPFGGLSNDFEFALYETVRFGGQVMGLIWLGLSFWLLGRFSQPLPEEQAGETIPTPAS